MGCHVSPRLLKTVQSQREPKFIDFVNEIRLGSRSQPSRQFADTLSGRVNPKDFGSDYIYQIYATNDEVEFSTFIQLETLDGELQTWRAVDNGDKNILNR